MSPGTFSLLNLMQICSSLSPAVCIQFDVSALEQGTGMMEQMFMLYKHCLTFPFWHH